MTGPNEAQVSSSPSARMPFIVSSNMEKVDPATRKLIRSHVMRGKKQNRSHPDKVRKSIKSRAVACRIEATRVEVETVSELYTSAIPGRVGSDISLVEFSDEIEPLVLLNLTKVSTIAMKIISPLIMTIGSQADNTEWLSIISLDAAALHVSAFAIEEFIDKVLRRQENRPSFATMLHFHRGVKLLGERLLGGDYEEKISDSTIGAVVKLANAAHFNGDYQIAKQHMNGVRGMVNLRGGLEVFQGKWLLVEMLRCDLGMALLNCSNHVFFVEPSEPVPAYPETLLYGDKTYSPGNIKWLQDINNELATAWRAMRRFCLLVNLGTQTQRPIRQEVIYETMVAVTYRLLHMNFAAGSMDEILRNGLLAFSYHVFLQWQDIKPRYNQFTTVYKNCIFSLQVADASSSQLILWLLMAGAVSVFEITGAAWLREYFRDYAERCQVKTWKEMQDILKSFMWIGLLDDQTGKHCYNLLLR